MDPGLQELMAAVAAQGIAPSGPWFSHHLRMDPNVFDFLIGVPVPKSVSPSGRVKPGYLLAGTRARLPTGESSTPGLWPRGTHPACGGGTELNNLPDPGTFASWWCP